jgi:hypothetical protein
MENRIVFGTSFVISPGERLRTAHWENQETGQGLANKQPNFKNKKSKRGASALHIVGNDNGVSGGIKRGLRKSRGTLPRMFSRRSK